ncbi:MAG: hypothetical protein HP042_08310 [Lachnospiraceae bacterium]|nr:hypothetical protein [Lachnospiraceae bacterium]
MKSFFASLLSAVAFTFLLFFPGIVLDGARYGLNLWFSTLVPTLLPFMVFSNFLIQSHLIEDLLYLPGRFTQKYLGLSTSGLYAFLCGFFFGYPSGAKILSDLLKTDQISQREASWLLGFCNNVSPAFLITYFLTLHLAHPEKIPLTFLLLYGIPAFLCLSFLFFRRTPHPFREKKTSKPVLSLALLDACIYDAITVLLKLGGYILLFAILSNAITYTPYLSLQKASFLISALEITNGIPAISDAFPYPESYLLLLPFLAFGGFCSIMQTGSVIKDTPLSLRNYFFTKILLTFLILLTEMLLLHAVPGLF